MTFSDDVSAFAEDFVVEKYNKRKVREPISPHVFVPDFEGVCDRCSEDESYPVHERPTITLKEVTE